MPIGDRLTGPAIAGTMAITEPLLRTGAGAGAIRAGIQYEAFVRDQQERCSTVVSLATGRDTERQRWARSERAHRAAARPRPTGGEIGPPARVLAWARPGRH